jgi:predicted GNAT superfamily acetyltransferase
MPGTVTVRLCRRLEEFARCVELQQAVWGFSDLDTAPASEFVVADKTGGQVIGAFDGARMIGFTMAFAGYREGRGFLHSHMTAVLPEFQNRGVGRALKLEQRREALERGIDLIEWTFDPLEVRNAYFNLVRLGAVVRRYIPDCYGATSSPLHAGAPTDRLVAEWLLKSRRVTAALRGRPKAPDEGAPRVLVPELSADMRKSAAREAARIQARVRARFQQHLAAGLAAVSFERDAGGGAYIFAALDS